MAPADSTSHGRKESVLGDGPSGEPTLVWMKARQAVIPSAKAGAFLDTYRLSRTGTDVYYQNCLDDSFLTAARTLADRTKRYRSPAEVKAWVQAQDLVFGNCSADSANGGQADPAYPAEPGKAISDLARADRLYQIAAAHFYAEDLDAAERLFRAIAEDTTSPWRKIASFMVGRTLLREYSLENKASVAQEARRQFTAIVSDPDAGTLRDSARGLLDHLTAIAHSAATLQSLSERLMNPRPDASFASALADARYISIASSFHPALSAPDIPEPFDWVRTLNSGGEAHALDQWRATKRLPWLTVALIHASGRDAAAPDLIAAAGHIPADSPAYVTVTYNALRLRMERGETDGPRAELDRLLANQRTQPPSVQNAWRAERIHLATNFDDFLRWASRAPTNARDFSSDPLQSSPILADDSVEVLNYRAPLSKIVMAMNSSRLAPWSKSQLAIAVWTRAFLLADDRSMAAAAPLIAKNHPAWAASLKPQPGPGAGGWRFQASLLIARNALYAPVLSVDFRKPLAANKWWWCMAETPANPDAEPPAIAWKLPVSMQLPESVISAAEMAEGRKQIERLKQIGSAQALVGNVILAWAKAHRDDPLVPEALHRVVLMRYGCNSESGKGLSKAAFILLHNRYPQNPWTAKTRYWFD